MKNGDILPVSTIHQKKSRAHLLLLAAIMKVDAPGPGDNSFMQHCLIDLRWHLFFLKPPGARVRHLFSPGKSLSHVCSTVFLREKACRTSAGRFFSGKKLVARVQDGFSPGIWLPQG
jgi:hypothetical protein